MISKIKTIQNTRVPSLGFGTWNLRGNHCEKVLESALEVGYRHIDTAEMYANEDAIGHVLKRSAIARNELFITSKVWQTHYSKNDFFKSVEQSLKSLQISSLDLLLLHWPADQKTNIEATEFLNICREMGYSKHIGVANFSMEQLKQAQKQAPVFCNQIKYHPYEKHPELVKYMQEQDLLITAYSPLDVGKLIDDKQLASIGRKHNKTASQVALRWLVQQKNVSAIPKASSKEHQIENLDIFDFELDGEDLDILDRK